MFRHWFPVLMGTLLLTCALMLPAHAGREGGEQMEITSQAFGQGGMIPPKYTCKGENVSPPIAWKKVPEGTKSITIICEDPDAPRGIWVHWVYYDIPPQASPLPENIPAVERPAVGGTQGITDSLTIGYEGPCPPSGTHRYIFRVFAVDTELNLPPGSTKEEVLASMEGHLLGMGELMGRFSK
ncbi:MAG: YbhB/YbcL family Raf kinase inhibitor-like protein [Desulfomonilia bacterium]|jgi:Raf kinase inhibitor-like YbhB/YbcL family protein|uniref:YbhB/YbcL family Raf kinase inhibitor-like protein n=1 Tax=anaerobic digester metagenome TaxID=1263854 RepID=A0A485M573_9ZZZZ|nr:YbhB/YbcL family Raf kinase inhibitor-like protein [Pseudomonadota bacterium]HRS54916.1 YbhB/YbcL family Raf kinase inhibitor-like protein [Desulfomonilia bacterium]HRV34329.1 YbhB/YbcL family Raf kinase inhibitor-like protein [Desulfomonilia bacterium]